jgi:hypothetical protein
MLNFLQRQGPLTSSCLKWLKSVCATHLEAVSSRPRGVPKAKMGQFCCWDQVSQCPLSSRPTWSLVWTRKQYSRSSTWSRLTLLCLKHPG